jgi:virginiamycin A acetyltransferase
VAVWEANHHLGRLSTYFVLSELFGELSDFDQLSKGPVEIGSDVWIGTRSLVLSGARIGDGAVIAAGSIVVDDIPPYAIALGSPAKVVRYRFPEDVRERLAALRWWDWDEGRIHANRFLFERDLTPEMLDRVT